MGVDDDPLLRLMTFFDDSHPCCDAADGARSGRADGTPMSAGVGLSRRRLLSAAAFGAGVFGLTRMGAVGAAPRVANLDEPGQALEPAVRIPPPTTAPAVIVPPSPFDPPAEGELLFPIVVNEGDHCLVLDNFGACRDNCSRRHEGVDIMSDEGLHLRAVVDGTITKIYTNENDGFCGVRLYDEENDVLYKYFHNTPNTNGWVEGDVVAQGDIIGFIGDTGTSTGNFHLHFEYRPGNIARDCFSILQRPDHVLFAGV